MVSNGASWGSAAPLLPVAMASPQHDTLPPARRTQLEYSPQDTWMASLMPVTGVQASAGTLATPLPIWPFPLAPTHPTLV
jgi:hypothetical protein